MAVKSKKSSTTQPKPNRNGKILIGMLVTALLVLAAGYFIKDKTGTPIITALLRTTKSSFSSADDTKVANSNSVAEKTADDPSRTVTPPQDAQTAKPADKQDDSATITTEKSGSQSDAKIALLPDTPKGGEQASQKDSEAAPLAASEKLPKTAELPPPQFEILRAEKDGSVVIAGQGPANSLIEIVEGDTVHGKTRSDASGNFAIIFETPLAKGDHELTILATPDEGNPVVSNEAGFVSVPPPGGEVFAMVSRPGEASKITQKPETLNGAQTAVLPEPPAPSTDQQVKSQASESVAAEPKAETSQAAAAEPEKEIPVLVQAIDVEPETLYIAGTGQPGKTISVYIDNVFEGQTKIGAQGTFLFSKVDTIARGRHAVRVDMLSDETGKVISRAEVVLEHQMDLLAEAEADTKIAGLSQQTPAPEKLVEPTDPSPDLQKPSVETPAPAAPVPVPATAATPEAKSDTSRKIEFGATIQAAPEAAQKTSPQEQPAVAPSLPSNSAGQAAGNAIKAANDDQTVVANVETAEKQVPVIQSGRSVIIRRGDSLWQVSRRMFGLGRKYTTIYAANRDQIRDPNLIFPGQVLAIPNAEAN